MYQYNNRDVAIARVTGKLTDQTQRVDSYAKNIQR